MLIEHQNNFSKISPANTETVLDLCYAFESVVEKILCHGVTHACYQNLTIKYLVEPKPLIPAITTVHYINESYIDESCEIKLKDNETLVDIDVEKNQTLKEIAHNVTQVALPILQKNTQFEIYFCQSKFYIKLDKALKENECVDMYAYNFNVQQTLEEFWEASVVKGSTWFDSK